MHSDLRAQAAFRLTGLRADAAPRARFRPALAARVRDLAALRHAFPVVLVTTGSDAFARTLSEVIDALADEPAPRAHLLRLEREMRGLVAGGFEGTLTSLWKAAAERLPGSAIRETAAAARRKLAIDGPVTSCDARFPAAFVAHAWRRVEARKAERLREEVGGLAFRLRQVLAADDAFSQRGTSAARLAETFGRGGEAFDLDAMAGLLSRVVRAPSLDGERRDRIHRLIALLENASLFTAADPEGFSFERCAPALHAWRTRETELRAFAAGLAMARLEVAGAYDESLHGALFRRLHESDLPAEELERLPSYLVTLRWQELSADERASIEELVCAGIPAKILVQFDDLLDERGKHGEIRGIASHAHALAGAALALGDVSVLQAPASVLPSMAWPLASALVNPAALLVSVFSGAAEHSSLPPYVNAAAALEARVFPAFAYDPSGGEAGELDLDGNPQFEAEWPLHELEFEDPALQRARRKVAFTPADFVAADSRFAAHFLPIEHVGLEEPSTSTVLVVDEGDRLHELLVDDQVAIQSRRCANRWRHLKRLAFDGVAAPTVEVAPPAEAEAPAPLQAPAPVEAPSPAGGASSDEAYIETPRCTTCNECTQINPRMFVYDGNKQAYIADPAAGTYRQLVEAAEACQVSIIHPGKPRDPDEPGVEDLVARAEAFR